MQGTRIIGEAHDQDTTDFHKIIRYIEESTPELDKTQVRAWIGMDNEM